MGDKRLETLEAGLMKLAEKNNDPAGEGGDRTIENVSSDSSLKSLGAIVFNSGTLTTNVAIIKTNKGFVWTLAVVAVVINVMAILVSTVQVQYARPTKIRDLPSEEVGVFTIILTFFLNFFKVGDNRRRKRDNSKTTDDRIDELDADLVGLKEDLESLKPLVSKPDQKKIEDVCKCLKNVSLNQLSNQPYTPVEKDEDPKGEQGDTTLGTTSSPDNPPKAASKGMKIKVDKKDAQIRAVLLSPDFIRGVQMAKRVLSQLQGNSRVLEGTPVAQALLPRETEGSLASHEEGAEKTFASQRSLQGASTDSANTSATQTQDVSTYDKPAGFVLRMMAILGLLGEDPCIGEDLFVKRKRVLLNVTYIDLMRKDLAARLTVSSSNRWTFPLWIQQLNLVATLLGLAVLVLDIVVATYAGNNPSKDVRT